MGNFNALVSKVVLPLSDLYTGWNVRSNLTFLLNSEKWGAQKLLEYQLERLGNIIMHSYKHVPYYRHIFDLYGLKPTDIKEISDLKKLPLLKKDDIINSFRNGTLLADNRHKQNCIFTQSSGSTGKRTQFFIDKNAYGMNLAANLRGWYSMGYRLGDRMIKISMNERNSFLKKAQDKLNNVELQSFKYDKSQINEFILRLAKTAPSYLRSYPDPLLFILKNVDEKLIMQIQLLGINTTGNMLHKELRDACERIFGIKIFDSYSCEGSPNLFECHTHQCYHSADEYGIVEIIDQEGKDVKPGEIGRIVVTDFFNYIMPFIRYESLDLARKGEICTCGRSHNSIKEIVGRDNDILVTPSGQYLIAQTFTTYFKYFSEIDLFQVHQYAENQLAFKLNVNSKLENHRIEKIINYWQKYTNYEMDVSVEITEDFKELPSGKRRFLFRAENIKLNV